MLQQSCSIQFKLLLVHKGCILHITHVYDCIYYVHVRSCTTQVKSMPLLSPILLGVGWQVNVLKSSELVGKTIKEAGFRGRFNAAVIAGKMSHRSSSHAHHHMLLAFAFIPK